MFSLAPTPRLPIVASARPLVFCEYAARSDIQTQLQDLTGDRGAGAVQRLLARAREGAKGLTATAVVCCSCWSAQPPRLPNCTMRLTELGGCLEGTA